MSSRGSGNSPRIRNGSTPPSMRPSRIRVAAVLVVAMEEGEAAPSAGHGGHRQRGDEKGASGTAGAHRGLLWWNQASKAQTAEPPRSAAERAKVNCQPSASKMSPPVAAPPMTASWITATWSPPPASASRPSVRASQVPSRQGPPSRRTPTDEQRADADRQLRRRDHPRAVAPGRADRAQLHQLPAPQGGGFTPGSSKRTDRMFASASMASSPSLPRTR
jgi:hypothetical protein